MHHRKNQKNRSQCPQTKHNEAAEQVIICDKMFSCLPSSYQCLVFFHDLLDALFFGLFVCLLVGWLVGSFIQRQLSVSVSISVWQNLLVDAFSPPEKAFSSRLVNIFPILPGAWIFWTKSAWHAMVLCWVSCQAVSPHRNSCVFTFADQTGIRKHNFRSAI